MNIFKLADKLSKKYLVSEAQTQVGTDNDSKFKFAMNALYRIVGVLQDPEYQKHLGQAKVNADNAISAFKFMDGKIRKYYNVQEQTYDIPEGTVLDGKNIFQNMMPDVTKAVTQVRTFAPADLSNNLLNWLSVVQENVQQINPEVFTP